VLKFHNRFTEEKQKGYINSMGEYHICKFEASAKVFVRTVRGIVQLHHY
jgi:hypothetical protein